MSHLHECWEAKKPREPRCATDCFAWSGTRQEDTLCEHATQVGAPGRRSVQSNFLLAVEDKGAFVE